MSALVNEIAELLYNEDSPIFPWSRAIDEDRIYYIKVAEVILDTVVEHLVVKDVDYAGAMGASIEHLRTETEIARLRRSTRAQ